MINHIITATLGICVGISAGQLFFHNNIITKTVHEEAQKCTALGGEYHAYTDAAFGIDFAQFCKADKEIDLN